MYKVFCDEYTLHDPSLNEVSYQLIDPVLTQEANKASGFTFTIPKLHANANSLHRLSSVITAYDDSKLIFRGRILNDKKDWNESRQVTCESDLAFLNDSVQRPYTFSGTVAAYFAQLITAHNSQVPAAKQFTVGTVDVSGNVEITSTAYTKTWRELEDRLINQFGGYLFVTWTGSTNRIDYLADSPYHCSQTISFAENLLDISLESKGENIVTALIPLGAKDDSGNPITIKTVNNNLDYIVDTAAANVYGLIFDTCTWDDITSPAALLLKGQARLAELSQGVTSTQLTAADLHLLDNEISSFDFLSYVTVEDLAHGVNGTMLVTKKTTNLTDPAQGKLTIGRESSGISKYYAETSDQVQTIRQTYATQEQVDTVNTTLQSEIQTQADKIALVVSESAGSYVIKSAEIVAAINESGSTVKISADHIALTGALIVSMINEGSTTINGNKITTGTLNASAIGAGTIDASVINVINLDASSITAGTISDRLNRNSWNLDSGDLTITTGKIQTTYTKTYYYADYDASDISRITQILYRQVTPTDADYEKYDIEGTGQIGPATRTRIQQIIDTQTNLVKTVTTIIDPSAYEYAIKITTDVPAVGTAQAFNYSTLYSGPKIKAYTFEGSVFKGLAFKGYLGGFFDGEQIYLHDGTYEKTITADGPTPTSGYAQVSVPTGTAYRTVTYFDLDPGTYLVQIHFAFATNTSGRRVGIVSYSENSSAQIASMWRASAAPVNGENTFLNICGMVKPNATTTFYLNAMQNSGSGLNTFASWAYVRLA